MRMVNVLISLNQGVKGRLARSSRTLPITREMGVLLQGKFLVAFADPFSLTLSLSTVIANARAVKQGCNEVK
jgi:hypothetical protein